MVAQQTLVLSTSFTLQGFLYPVSFKAGFEKYSNAGSEGRRVKGSKRPPDGRHAHWRALPECRQLPAGIERLPDGNIKPRTMRFGPPNAPGCNWEWPHEFAVTLTGDRDRQRVHRHTSLEAVNPSSPIP